MLGQTISHYRITDKLGAGGMGVVYKAIDLTLERTVALKFLPADMVVSKQDKDNLLREARAASALDHPNIGVIHGLEESEDHQLFIVMAYCEGETLSQKLARGVLPAPEALDVAIQIADGLSAAHARSMVHRDIKPSNIIITKDGTAKIVDFGLARMVASASATQSSSATGTLPYMAPEQILGESVDRPCDVWALAVILVQLLTGSHPFVRPNTAAMTFAILNQPPAALDAVPTAIQPILYKALAKVAAQRYPDAGAMLKDLEGARAAMASAAVTPDEPTLAEGVSPRELRKYVDGASTPRWTAETQERPRWRIWAPSAVLLAVLSALLLPRVRENLSGFAYAGSEKHIAVLPFEVANDDPESRLLADGLMDSTTNELSNLGAAQASLWVVPSSVVRSHRVTDPASAYRELGATMVVGGRIERRGTHVILTVNLIDSKRLRQIGSEKLESTGDFAALQNVAVARLARMMRLDVPETALQDGAHVEPSAYESYLKALGYMQRYDRPGNLDKAISVLDSAVQRDPRFALAYATLGEAYRLKFETENHPGWLSQAATNAQKAVEINDRLPAAHATLGDINLTLGKTDLALQEFQKALDLAPRDPSAAMGLAATYEFMNRPADAEASYKRAIALRPDYWDGYTALANFYDRQKRIPEAITQYKRVMELTPDNAQGYADLGAEYLELDTAEGNAAAEVAYRKSIQLAPNYFAYAGMGVLYLNQKRYTESAEATRKALELNDKDWQVWNNLQIAYTWLKDQDKLPAARARTMSLLEQYAAVNTQHASVQSALGIFYAEDQLREKAVARANTALALSPTDPVILTDVAEIYNDLGDRKTAVRYANESMQKGSTLLDFQRRPTMTGVLADPSFRPKGKQ